MSINARNKGHTFERAIMHDFSDMGWEDVQTSRAASRLADDCKIDLVGVMPFAVQCKRMRKYAPINEILKIDFPTFAKVSFGNADIDYIPLLLTKADNLPTMAVLPWDELKKMLTKIYHGRS